MKVPMVCMALAFWAFCAASALGTQIEIVQRRLIAGSEVHDREENLDSGGFRVDTAVVNAATYYDPWTGECDSSFDGIAGGYAQATWDGRYIELWANAHIDYTQSATGTQSAAIAICQSSSIARVQFIVKGGNAQLEWTANGYADVADIFDAQQNWDIVRLAGGGLVAGQTNVPGLFGGTQDIPATATWQPYQATVEAFTKNYPGGVGSATFSTALEADIYLSLRFFDPTDYSMVFVSGSPVAASHQVDTPTAPFDFSFSHLFETTTGQLRVLLGGTEVARIDAPARLPSEFQTETLRIDNPVLLGLSDVPLEFLFDGPTGSRVIADNVVFPGLINGDFTGPAPVVHQVDTPAEAFDLSFSYLFENNFTRQPEGRLQVFLDGTEVARVEGLGVRQSDFQTETVRIDDPALLGLSDAPLAFVFEAAYNNDVFVRDIVFPGVQDGDFPGLYPIRARDQSDFSGWTAVAGSPTLDYTPIRIVPEPPPLALLIAGTMAVLGYGWRKRAGSGKRSM
jgi:hypothetical protein